MEEPEFDKQMFTREVVDWDNLWDPPEPEVTPEIDFDRPVDPYFLLPAVPNGDRVDPYGDEIVREILDARERKARALQRKAARLRQRRPDGRPGGVVAQNMRAEASGFHGLLGQTEWDALAAAFGGCCAYCGIGTARLVVEHVVPLSRGGRNDIYNVVPACARCNIGKGPKDPIRWMGRHGHTEAFFARTMAANAGMGGKKKKA